MKRLNYDPFALPRLFVSDKQAILAGSDRQRLIAISYNSNDIAPFQVLKGHEARKWTQRITTNVITVGVGAEPRRFISLAEKPFRPVSFGPSRRFTLVQEEKTSYEPRERRLLVVEKIGNTAKQYRLPNTNYDEFARARPASVKNGLTRQAATIDEEI